MTPHVSIVIPTHNRRHTLQRGLRSLAAQSYPLSLIEVVVVADGCTDGTEHVVIDPPLTGRVIAQPAAGPAAARNAGAAIAGGDLLLFLDDDVEAWPELVEGHVQAHAATSGDALVVGYLSANPQNGGELFRTALRGWWEVMFERMEQPGHRFTYADVLTGNCSISRALFQAVSGFEEQLHCHEDYEFGLRVLRAGGVIRFEHAAGASHADVTDLPRSLRRKHEEGAADVWIARAHRDVWPALPLARPCASRRASLVRELALNRPLLGGLFDAAARRYSSLLARARLRVRWSVLRDDLLCYWYWRGVADALKDTSFAKFREQVTSRVSPGPDLPCVDLRQGLASAMGELDRLASPGVVLYYDKVYVGTIAPQPWAEPLRGRHLRHVLSTTLRTRLGQAIATARGLGESGGSPEHAGVSVCMSRPVCDDDRCI
jgi:glycosyltransferase involved in cell wall biosynthesis